MQILEKYLTQNPCYQANVDIADNRYRTFQQRGPLGLMLHSVGCAQPSAMVFINGWNKSTYDRACVHAFIDANSGTVYQTLPWNFRGWHCGGSGNNTHIGVEMCESGYIRYTSATKFDILDAAKAKSDCERAYQAAVKCFAAVCKEYNLNPLTAICSHKEGSRKGIASDHGDPEHYWSGLGMNYTMDGFRQDVKNEMEESIDMTVEELNAVLNQRFSENNAALTASFSAALERAMLRVDSKIQDAVGKRIDHVSDIPWDGVRETVQKLLDADAINGGTPREEDDSDINMNLEDVRVMAVMQKYIENYIKDVITSKKEEE